MINKIAGPTPMFWNCAGLAVAALGVGMCVQLFRTKSFELQFAEYRLRNGYAVNQARDATESVKQNVINLPINQQEKRRLLHDLNESETVLEQTEAEIVQDSKQFTQPQLDLDI